MKNLFNNLLLNHRFVFQENPAAELQQAAEAAKKANETEASAELDDLVGKGELTQEKSNEWFDREAGQAQETGKEKVNQGKKELAKLDIEQYLEKLGSEKRPIKLEEMTITGARGSEANPIRLDEIAIQGKPAKLSGEQLAKAAQEREIQFEDEVVTARPEKVAELRAKITPSAEGEQLAKAAQEAEKATEQPDYLLASKVAIQNLSRFTDTINAQLGKGAEAGTTTADKILNGIKKNVKELVKKGDYQGLDQLNKQINSSVKIIEEGLKAGDMGTSFIKKTAEKLEKRFG